MPRRKSRGQSSRAGRKSQEDKKAMRIMEQEKASEKIFAVASDAGIVSPP
jgi:hypothetical protein